MKKKTSVVATSVAAIAVCTSLIAGTTYALFTSESKVNIAVTSAKVDVVATVGEIEKTGLNGVAFVEAKQEGNEITLNNIAPGDVVSFPVTVTNNSTIEVKSRMTYTVSGSDALAEVLAVTVNKEAVTTGSTKWAVLEDKTVTLNVVISLPEGVNGDKYEGQTCNIALKIEAVQGNATTYDYEVSSESELVEAIAEGGNIKLADNIELTGAFNLKKDILLNLNGNQIINNVKQSRIFVMEEEGVSLTIDATDEGSEIVLAEGNTTSYGLVDFKAPDLTVVVNGGTYDFTVDNVSAFKVCAAATGWDLTLNNVTAKTNCLIVGSETEGKLTVKDGYYTLEGNNNLAGFCLGASVYNDKNTEMYANYNTVSYFENVTIISQSKCCVEVAGTKATFVNCHFGNPDGRTDSTWLATAIGVDYQGYVIIEGGDYSGKYGAYVYSSGGTIIIEDGTFSGTDKDIKADFDINYQQYGAQNSYVEIKGGTLVNNTTSRGNVNDEQCNIVDNR